MIIPVSEFDSISLSEIVAAKNAATLDTMEIAIYPDVLSRGLIRIERRADKKRIGIINDFITPIQIVGLLPLAKGISLWVNPKVPVSNIDYMAKRYGTFFSPGIKEIRKYDSSYDTSLSLWENLAQAIVDLCERIASEGIWREYVEKQIIGSPTGRIDANKTINHLTSRNIGYKVVSTFYVREADTAPNRILRQAVELVSKKASESGTRINAQRLSRIFQHVSPLRNEDLAELRDTASVFSRSRPLYARALPIAEAILLDEGLDS